MDSLPLDINHSFGPDPKGDMVFALHAFAIDIPSVNKVTCHFEVKRSGASIF